MLALIALKDMRVGSKVIVRGSWGTDAPKLVTVNEVCSDIKNGFAGIDYLEADNSGRWCYLDQVKQVVTY